MRARVNKELTKQFTYTDHSISPRCFASTSRARLQCTLVHKRAVHQEIMEGTKACTIVIVCVLVSAALVAGQAYNMPAVSFNARYNSYTVCPPDTHLDAVKTELSNKISDVLATKFPCGGTGWRRIAYLNMTDPDQTCPGQWRLYEQDTIKACGRKDSIAATCDSVQFSSNG